MKNGNIKAIEFVERFSYQVKTNYERLEKFDFIKMRTRFKKLVTNIEQAFERRIMQVITNGMIVKLDRLYKDIFGMRDIMLDERDYVDKHLDFCLSFLERIKLDLFGEQSTNVIKYLQKYQKVLSEVFDTEEINLPKTIPHIQNLSDELVEMTNMQEYEAVKKTYTQLKKSENDFYQAIPQKYPQTLPNLSTHDGRPFFQVDNREDFILIVTAYGNFINRMETLKGEWVYTIRYLYDSLETTKCFVNKEVILDKKEEPKGGLDEGVKKIKKKQKNYHISLNGINNN